MRIFAAFIVLCCVASTKGVTNANPAGFENAVAMHQWATSCFGGADWANLTYKKHKLVVYLRCHTSGRATCEPVVFLERGERWVRVFSATVCPFEMEVTREKAALVLWRLDWTTGKRRRSEFLKFNLEQLDSILDLTQ